jgi:ankyrin repeat protein
MTSPIRLLKTGCAVDQTNATGRTALMMAAMFGREHQIEALLARHANSRLKDAHGNTASDLAHNQGADQIAAKLRQTE